MTVYVKGSGVLDLGPVVASSEHVDSAVIDPVEHGQRRREQNHLEAASVEERRWFIDVADLGIVVGHVARISGLW